MKKFAVFIKLPIWLMVRFISVKAKIFIAVGKNINMLEINENVLLCMALSRSMG